MPHLTLKCIRVTRRRLRVPSWSLNFVPKVYPPTSATPTSAQGRKYLRHQRETQLGLGALRVHWTDLPLLLFCKVLLQWNFITDFVSHHTYYIIDRRASIYGCLLLPPLRGPLPASFKADVPEVGFFSLMIVINLWIASFTLAHSFLPMHFCVCINRPNCRKWGSAIPCICTYCVAYFLNECKASVRLGICLP